MLLVWLIVIPFLAGPLAWLSEHRGHQWPRWISLAALAVDLVLGLVLWVRQSETIELTQQGKWIAEWSAPWISRWGITFHVAMDGLSLLLVLLTAFLGGMAVFSSWTEINERVGFFHFNVLWVLTGVIGVFLAMDLFLFFLFWEVMLIPMYFIINIWGHEDRVYAALKFFLFTHAGSLLMLIAILALVFINYQHSRIITFDYFRLLGAKVEPSTAMWLMLGFFAAFAVKLPVVPFHTWLPDAHTEAPTGGSVILAGLLLKTGAYGLLRFTIPLFPQAALAFAPIAMVLGVIGILYGAVLAFAQTDLKRLVAYSSVSHLGFALVGIFAWNGLALQGAVMQLIAHGISTGALFMVVGAIQERIHTRDSRRMGGLWATVPKMAAIALFFAIASLGLPGLGNFIGEFLVLLGTYPVSIVATVAAAGGLVAAVIYSLAFMHRAFYGPNTEGWRIPDFSRSALVMFGTMIVVQIWLGMYPQPVLKTVEPALNGLRSIVDSMIVTSTR